MQIHNSYSNFFLNLIVKVLVYSKCIIACNTAANQATTFAMTDTKLYVAVVTLSTLNYYNNWNQVLKKQLIGMNINQK